MLISGDSYSLKGLFTKNNRIIIPDMQREYCWAHTISTINNENLVEKFVGDLLESNKNAESEIQLGLLYAYESPKNDFQLCDGQQRITTLYLLLGFLYSNTSDAELKKDIKNFLVVDANEDKMSYDIRLQYAIRESTLFFLNDLVNQFFLAEKEDDEILPSEKIKKSDWDFNEYRLDPSIQNMLVALDKFHQRKDRFTDKFRRYLLENIRFLYFDMENRMYGEEQFVVLNTTGEPLTKTENLKPLFLGELDNSKSIFQGKTQLRYYADLWEEWELFFWENKRKEEQTADAGMKEFFRWIFIIESSNPSDNLQSEKENYNTSQNALAYGLFDIFELGNDKTVILDTIDKYFEALKRILSDQTIRERFLFRGNLSQIALFELLPLIYFLKGFDLTIEEDSFIRLKQFLSARAKDDNVSKATITTAIRAVQIVKVLIEKQNSDIAVYSDYESVAFGTVLTNIEKLKFDVLLCSNNRGETEKAFWRAEGFQTSQGNIGYIFEVLKINEASDFKLAPFIKMSSIILESLEKPTDLLRRALLTFGHYFLYETYTYKIEAWRYYLGEDASFFNRVFKEGPEEKPRKALLMFLCTVNKSLDIISEQSLASFYQTCINEFQVSEGNIWVATVSKLIKNEAWIEKMAQKRFCVTEDKLRSYALKQKKVTSMDKIILMKEMDS